VRFLRLLRSLSYTTTIVCSRPVVLIISGESMRFSSAFRATIRLICVLTMDFHISVPSRLTIHVPSTGQQQGPVPMQLDGSAAQLPAPPATVYTGRSFSVMSDVDAALVDPRMYLLTEGEQSVKCCLSPR
jgi:hypothetical protein